MKKAMSIIALAISPIIAATPCFVLLTNNSKNPEIKQHTVTFTSSDSVKLVGSTEIKVNDKTKWKDVTKPSVLYDSDVEPIGWYNGSEAISDDYQITGDFNAKFIGIKPSDIFVNVTVVTAKDTYKDNYYIQTSTWADFKQYYEITKDPEKEGYKFIGWFVKGTSTEVKDDFVFEAGKTEITIEARFQNQNKKVSFDKTDGVTFEPESPGPIEVEPDTTWGSIKDRLPKVTIDPNYEDLGWYIGGTGTKLTDDYKISNNLGACYYALNKQIDWITINVKVDQTVQSYKYLRGDGQTWGDFVSYYRIKTPSKEGHTFDGWYINDQKIESTYVLPQQEEITVEAKFVAKKYTVTFSVDKGGSFVVPPSPIQVEYGTKWGDIAKPTVKVEAGYKERGWYGPKGILTDDTVINNNLNATYKLEDMSILKVQVIIKVGAFSRSYQYYRAKTWANFKETYSIQDPWFEKETFDGWFYEGERIKDSWTFPLDKSVVTIEAKSADKFQTDSWETVVNNAKNGLAGLQQAYKMESFVGLERNVTINNNAYKVRVIGQDHDELADGSGKAALTFELESILSDENGMSIMTKWDSTNNFDYTKSIIRANLNGGNAQTWKKSALEMLAESEPALSNALKTVNKTVALTKQYTTDTKYNDKLFLLTCKEAGLPTDRARSEGQTYAYWVGKALDEHKKSDIYGLVRNYWLSSPYLEDERCAFSMSGGIRLGDYVYKNSKGVSFAFCI